MDGNEFYKVFTEKEHNIEKLVASLQRSRMLAMALLVSCAPQSNSKAVLTIK